MGSWASRFRWMLVAVSIAAVAALPASDSPADSAQPPATQPARRDWPPKPPAAEERARDRDAMVREQIAQAADGRERVTNAAVLDALRAVPRHAFVPAELRKLAYDDSPLPIGHGQTISQPYIVAVMTELVAPGPSTRVLEIGTGSGYQAAVLAQLTPHVYSIEIIDALARRARATLDAQGYQTVTTRTGDGYFGWKEEGPYDAIIVTAAAGHVPAPLWEQLAPGGRMVIPIGGAHEVQRLLVITKQPDGTRRSRTVTAVRFVPMTGEIERK